MDQVLEFFQQLFGVADFPARWRCGRWTEFHGWLYIISDTSIALAYFAIPILIIYLISKRKDVPLMPIFWLFAAFILFCGSTHLMDAITFWWPAYRFNGLLRLGTATVSWVTVFALVKAVPVALTFKSPTQLQRIIDQQTASLKQSNRELEQFSYTVSHDLRTPLHSIMLSSEIIKEECQDKVDKETVETLNLMQKNVHNMSTMIAQILDFSRLGNQEIEHKTVNMKALFQEEAELLRLSAKERKVNIRIGELHDCSGNQVLIQRVITNLLTNALKYTSGEEKASIEIESKPNNGFIEYMVKDNGEGIDPKNQHSIFELFKRFSSKKTEGSGLGLAIAKKIIEQHGGRIWVESRPGEGATFFFTLPKS